VSVVAGAGLVGCLVWLGKLEDAYAALDARLANETKARVEWEASQLTTAAVSAQRQKSAAGHPPRKPAPLKPFEYVKGNWHGNPMCG
jgi:hypothetical protein